MLLAATGKYEMAGVCGSSETSKVHAHCDMETDGEK